MSIVRPYRFKSHARVVATLVLAFVCLAATASVSPFSGAASAQFELDGAGALSAQVMPRRKPGDEPPAKQELVPRPKPAEEENAEPEPEESAPPPPARGKEKSAPQEEHAEGFVWNERDQKVSQTIEGIGKWVLIALISLVLAAAFFLAFWVLKIRSWVLCLFIVIAWVFEFYALGMRFTPVSLAFLAKDYVPAAIMGLAASVMLEATLGPRLPGLYRRILTIGFGLFFAGMLAAILLAAPVPSAWVKYGYLVAVPFVLYAQVLTRGRGLGRSFGFGLFLLVLAIVAAAVAPLFINTGVGAPVPLALHGLFIAGLAFLIFPPKPVDEFTEDFYHTGNYGDQVTGTPRPFEEPGGFEQGARHNGNDRFDGDYDDGYEDNFADEGEWQEDWDDRQNNEPRFDSASDWRTEDANDYADIAASEDLSHLERRTSAPTPTPAPRSTPMPSQRRGSAVAPLGTPTPLGDENRYELGIAGAHQGLWDWSIEHDELYLSPSVDGMLGLPSQGMVSSEVAWAERVHADDFHAYRDALRTYISRGNTSFDLEFRVRHDSGDYIWMKLRATCLPDETGLAARCVGTIADITASKNTVDRLNQSSERDPLTGLANRTTLTGRLDDLLANTHDPEGLPSLIVIDLDRFKTVNDSLGQAGGDALLQTVARRLEDVTGSAGLVSRLGSDEFAILVYKQPGVRPGVIAAKALDTLAQPVELAGHEVFPMASLGLAEAGIHHRRSEDLLKDAETAMFRAKRQGGGSVETYESSMTHQTIEALSLETDLRRALERQQMEVLFQPIMDFRTERVAGFEALLRWRHPTHGLMTPDQFVSLAEANDMIVPLGRFVLSMASNQLAMWQRQFPVSPPLFVSVNVSSRQLKRVDFADDVREVLETARIMPGTLKLEVTESLIQEDPILAENLLREVQSIGAGIVLDDFGTGFASLANLQRYPFDTIKVDRSFVSTMTTRSDSHVIVNSIVTLANDLGLTVIAEGLESEDDKHRIRQMGCDFGQGFIFGPPMNTYDAQNFIAHHWS